VQSGQIPYATTFVLIGFRLGLLQGKVGERAGRLADWTWFAGTIVALIELSMERSIVGNLIRAGAWLKPTSSNPY
jgi:hypothetical protein